MKKGRCMIVAAQVTDAVGSEGSQKGNALQGDIMVF
jgi:hypothetical protein